jgi:hypothetical protein
MKLNLHNGSLILLITISCIAGCKKEYTTNQTTPPSGGNPPSGGTVQQDTTFTAPVIPYPVSPALGCNYAPDYGDSIVYTQPTTGSDYFVFPRNNQGIKGTYMSWPQGLVMNSATGAVDLSQSDKGQRYSVGFVKEGSSDTCLSQLIVGGIAYMDSVYVLSNSDTTSKPYYDANPFAAPPCLGSSGPGPGCQFDYNGYAQNQGIAVDSKTGFIDLKKTMANHPFGLLLLNGVSVTTRIYYKLNDQSNYAPQMIQLKLMYYNHKSDIPSSLLGTITTNLINTLTNLLISKGPSARPPLIIIVRDN